VPERVRITDVSPRDGLQNEPGVIPTPDKVRLVELLCGTGVDEVEVTSFVSAKWVPQLADAREVLGELIGRWPRESRPSCSVLVPNQVGMEGVLEINDRAMEETGRRLIDTVALFTAASETFTKKNINATISESLDRFQPVLDWAWKHRLRVRFYISCAYGCPFEGEVDPRAVRGVVAGCISSVTHSRFTPGEEGGFAGVDIAVSDTIGIATPRKIQAVHHELDPNDLGDRLGGYWAELSGWRIPATLTLHLHDTHGRATECVRTALDLGVRSFDGSVAGLGGCPYASKPGQRAPGNIATETLVRTIQDAGYETGVDLARLAEAAAFAREIVGKSRTGGAGTKP